MGSHISSRLRRCIGGDDRATTERAAAMPMADMPATTTAMCFADFVVMRAIGRGAFGKVCIVQRKHTHKKDTTPKYFAMKYVNKRKCVHAASVHNVLREMSLMASLRHPFCVNLWYTFHDARDMFMVCDLLLGGDLRYHLNEEGRFDEARVKLYACELAVALAYLHGQRVIHRDVKPDNILLDDGGHAHLTDFNVATRLEAFGDCLATSVTGTRPYMAPEMYACATGECIGYDYAVDWWSLGVCVYEMLRGRRPFDFAHTMAATRRLIMTTQYTVPSDWSIDLVSFIAHLLERDPHKRIRTLRQFRRHEYTCRVNFADVLAKRCAPVFMPRTDALNVDPTYELEEHIVESNPIHARKARVRSAQNSICSDGRHGEHAAIDAQFNVYNRETQLTQMDEHVKQLAIDQDINASNVDAKTTDTPTSAAPATTAQPANAVYIIGNLSGTPTVRRKQFALRNILRRKKI